MNHRLPQPGPLLAVGMAVLAVAPGVVAWALGSPPLQGLGAAPLAQALATALVLGLVWPRLWLGLLLLAPAAVLAPVELWYIAAYGQASDAHVLGILAETDWQEARAFAAGVAVPMLLAVVAAAALAVAVVRMAWRGRWTWQHRSRLWLWGAALAALLLPFATDRVAPEGAPGELAVDTTLHGTDRIAENALPHPWRQLSWTYPLGLPLRLAEFSRYRMTLGELSDTLATFRFQARQQPHGSPVPRQVHVLVIGETGRPDRWQLNGYARPTSPRLAAEPALLSLRNMVSPWAWTRMSVPIIVSRKPGTERRPFFHEKSLVSAFREAGFRTYWFSTQSPLGQHDSSIALHASESDEVRFINPGNYKQRAALDGELLPLVQSVLERGEPRQLIVLHTLGSHYNYSHRHPPAFELFRPSLNDEPQPSLQDRAQRVAMSNAYDNSVAYTDHVLAELIQALRATGAEATMFYVADHGENLFDGECKLSGHGRATERDFRVPAFFWPSDAYAARHAPKLAQLRERLDAPLSTENVFHSLLDAADIRYPDERPSASFFHPSWQPRPRIVQTGLDFDRAYREPTCLSLLPAAPSTP